MQANVTTPILFPAAITDQPQAITTYSNPIAQQVHYAGFKVLTGPPVHVTQPKFPAVIPVAVANPKFPVVIPASANHLPVHHPFPVHPYLPTGFAPAPVVKQVIPIKPMPINYVQAKRH